MTRAERPPEPPSASPFEGLSMEAGGDVVAAGGDLEPTLVMDAYRHGVFPWFDAGEPVLWWSPDPRAILPLEDVHLPRRLVRTLRSGRFEIRFDTAFAHVIAACDEDRPDGSWIHDEMRACYLELHAQGHAHSCEAWLDGALAGGAYGVAFGGGFAAESMFHRVRDASKVALASLVDHLRERGFGLLDVQFTTPHLETFGCVEIPRDEYLERVRVVRDMDVTF